MIRVEVARRLFVHQSPAGYLNRVGSSKRPIPPDPLARLFQQRSQSRLVRFDPNGQWRGLQMDAVAKQKMEFTNKAWFNGIGTTEMAEAFWRRGTRRLGTVEPYERASRQVQELLEDVHRQREMKSTERSNALTWGAVPVTAIFSAIAPAVRSFSIPLGGAQVVLWIGVIYGVLGRAHGALLYLPRILELSRQQSGEGDDSMLVLGRYRFHLLSRYPVNWQGPPAAVIRGALGNQLKRVACQVDGGQCASCPLTTGCAYAVLFEPQPGRSDLMQRFESVPRPFILDVSASPQPGGGHEIFLDLTLIGPANRFLRDIWSAVERIARRGLSGPSLTLRAISWQGPGDSPPEPEGELSPWQPSGRWAERIGITAVTPLRMLEGGRLVRSVPFPLLFRTLFRRVQALQVFWGEETMQPGLRETLYDLADRVQLTGERWVLHEEARYSTRQRRMVPLTGILGEAWYEGEMMPLLPYLELGTWVHVGKGSAVGLGAYRLDVPTPYEP